MARIFVSYSSADHVFVDRLAFDLERDGHGIWYDKWELKVGDSLLDKIQEGIQSHDYIAVILSKYSVSSEWVKRELNAGLMRELEEKTVVVLPVLIEDCIIPPLLKEKKFADFRKDYECGLDDLLTATSPTSIQAIKNTRSFRITHYLISGLVGTDQRGTNTLNSPQLESAYRHRHALRAFLSDGEKRLLFWSAAAFRKSNPHTPFFRDTTTPVWGLTEGSTTQQHAQWIIYGLEGPLFEHLVPHAGWAVQESQQDAVRSVIETYCDVLTLSPPGAVSPEAMSYLFDLLAVHARDIFIQLIPRFKPDLPVAPIFVRSTASLSPPMKDDFYLSLERSGDEVVIAAVHALSKLERTTAVELLRRRLSREPIVDSGKLDLFFSELTSGTLAPQLLTWKNTGPPLEIAVRIHIALANMQPVDPDETLSLIDRAAQEHERSLSSLVHVLARYCRQPESDLIRWLSSRNPILCEAAVFGLGRRLGKGALPLLSPLLKSESETILAAVAEALGKHAGRDEYVVLRSLGNHKSPLVRSALYRGLSNAGPEEWGVHLPVAIEDQHPVVRLCAARAWAHAADRSSLESIVDDESKDQVFRSTADEKLYAPRYLGPDWLAKSAALRFNTKLAGLPVRLTDFDPDIIAFRSDFDVARILQIFGLKDIS